LTRMLTRLPLQELSAMRHLHTAAPLSMPYLNTETDAKPHFRRATVDHPIYKDLDEEGKPVWIPPIPNKCWSEAEVMCVQKTHVQPKDFADWVAYGGIRLVRFGFDLFSGYMFGPITETKLLRRIIFLETVAGIPGMVAASLRHLRSLRTLKRDQGWVPTLLEEAENERMHALVFTRLKNPGLIYRTMVLLGQGVFWNTYFFFYLFSPRTCHRFVGYLEEEAVKTYTDAINTLDSGSLPRWSTLAAPDIAKTYWGLTPDATMRDVLLAVRADEANHRDTNHTLSDIKTCDVNPYMIKEYYEKCQKTKETQPSQSVDEKRHHQTGV